MTDVIEATLATTTPLCMDAGGGTTMECEMANGVLELSKYMKWEDFNKPNAVRSGGEPTDREN